MRKTFSNMQLADTNDSSTKAMLEQDEEIVGRLEIDEDSQSAEFTDGKHLWTFSLIGFDIDEQYEHCIVQLLDTDTGSWVFEQVGE